MSLPRIRVPDLALQAHVRAAHLKFKTLSTADQEKELARQREEIAKRAIERELERLKEK